MGNKQLLKTFFVSAFIAAASAIAFPPRRVGALTVSVSASTTVTSTEDLKFVAEVTNIGAEVLKVFNYGTVLDNTRHNKSFVVFKVCSL